MSRDHIHHIDHVIIKTCKLIDTIDDGTTTGGGKGVLAVNDQGKITRIPGGIDGQLLARTTTSSNGIGWINSSASSAPNYQLLTFSGTSDIDPTDYADSTQISGSADVYAIEINENQNYSNLLTNTGVLNGHLLIITIIAMASGGRYRLYSDNCVYSGNSFGYFEMDSVGQGVQLIHTNSGWAVVGGGGATLGST